MDTCEADVPTGKPKKILPVGSSTTLLGGGMYSATMSAKPTVGNEVTEHSTVAWTEPLGTGAEHNPGPPASLKRTWPPGKEKFSVGEEPPVTTALKASMVPWTTFAGDTLALVFVGAALALKGFETGGETAAELLSSAGSCGVKVATISRFVLMNAARPGEHAAVPAVTGAEHRVRLGFPGKLKVTVPEAPAGATVADTQSAIIGVLQGGPNVKGE
jgi:hypothetical protein